MMDSINYNNKCDGVYLNIISYKKSNRLCDFIFTATTIIISKLRDAGNYKEAAQVSSLYRIFNQNTTPSRLSQNQNQEQEVSRDL